MGSRLEVAERLKVHRGLVLLPRSGYGAQLREGVGVSEVGQGLRATAKRDRGRAALRRLRLLDAQPIRARIDRRSITHSERLVIDDR